MAGKAPARTKAPSRAAIPQLAWNQTRPAPLVLITGPEQFLADRALRFLRDFLRAEDPSLEVSDIDAGAYAPGELLTLASPSLFDEPRLLRVSNVEKCTDAFLREALDYLVVPAPGTTVALRHTGGNRGKKLLDAIRSGAGGGIEIVCAELKRESDKITFAAAEFRSAGRTATTGALRALVSAFADDLDELASACQQLLADVSGDITDATVARYYGGRVDTTAFAVADAAIAGRHGEALLGLRHAFASGADPVAIVAAFASKLRTMAKVFGSREGSSQLASGLGLASWQVDRARRDLQGWTGEGLGSAILAIADADANVKGATRDPVYALERVVSVVSARGC
ncbi:DNA polymerase III subunit delta [Rathayibacter toxicus]|uniref:DNA-directed DNA polymerase n=1 Tax=Rathayibacter toxicus TaxID=145458 RepID=A0A2S5Y5T9_9MICO|nr:hypothetical protein [Rathayibacter toxicus]PPH22508.1 DNA polymerase III subunit delta [Rathayibacter toxicus]PPH57151.1 DNA polymerase III subunit delta [Rathayibacter toxicus]PPH59402.1 DNA polymerase III subunit delta [Rathayibacter toxicus]PPH86631.1 DNA polymerase III subunit delta [Rathayibacter toxicus]PPI14349.1 DNA polymerase III subunit delta [Rathayibacter toxicus]